MGVAMGTLGTSWFISWKLRSKWMRAGGYPYDETETPQKEDHTRVIDHINWVIVIG